MDSQPLDHTASHPSVHIMQPKSSNTPTLVQCPPCTWHTVGCGVSIFLAAGWALQCFASVAPPGLCLNYSPCSAPRKDWVTSWVCQRVGISPPQLSPSSDTFSFPLRAAQFGHLKNRCFLTTTVYHEYFWSLNLGKLLGFCWFSGEQTKQLPSPPCLKW